MSAPADEALALGEKRAVLGDERVSAEDEVCRRFPDARTRIDVARQAPGGLSRHERPAVVGLANELVRSAQVKDDVRPAQREARRGRIRGPHVLADLDAEDHPLSEVEDEVVAERDVAAGEDNARVRRLESAREPARLVELMRAREVGLRNDAQKRSAADKRRTVEDAPVETDRQSHGESQSREALRRLHEVRQRRFRVRQEGRPVEEVRAGVAREAQLRENDDIGALRRSLGEQTLHALQIGADLRRLHQRHRRCNAHKVFHG